MPTELRQLQFRPVEKGESMEYEAPALEIVGPASELIQNYFGPNYDGDAFTLSLGFVCSGIDEE